jgi:hypothetical protein
MKAMRRVLVAALLLAHQTAAPLPEPKNWTAAQDHQQMIWNTVATRACQQVRADRRRRHNA